MVLSAAERANKTKLVYMIKEANRLLSRYNAEMVEDSPTRSVTHSTVNPNSKNIPDPTAATQSKYQTKDQCIAGIIAENPAMSSTDAGNYCDTIYGNQQKMALKKKQALILSAPDQWYQDCIDSGTSVTDCSKQRDELYPTDTPSPKSASTTPAWIVASDIPTNHLHNTTNIRSAASQSDKNYFELMSRTVSDVMADTRRERERQADIKNRTSIKSGSSVKPKWAQSLSLFNEF